MTTVKHRIHHRNTNHGYDLASDLARIRSAFSDAGTGAKDKAEEMFLDSLTNIKERSLLAKDSVADYASDKPFKTMGAALLMGLAIGYFIRK